MTLAIIGAGSLGQAAAALLAESGNRVVLLASERTATALRQAGQIRLRGAVEATVPVSRPDAKSGVIVTTDPADLPRGAGVLFMTKGHDLPAAMATVRAAWPAADDAEAWVGGVQNGLAKDDMLGEVFGAERVVGAVTILAGQREADGGIAVSSRGATYLGELAGDDTGVSARAARAAEVLNAAGIPTEATAEIQSALWSKACNAAGVFGVSVLCRISAPRLFRTPSLIRAYLGLVRETAALAAAHGVPVKDYPGFPIRTYVRRSDEETVTALAGAGVLSPSRTGGVESLPSMTQDLLAGRPMEVEAVFGDLVARAGRANIAVPRLELVTNMLRGLGVS